MGTPGMRAFFTSTWTLGSLVFLLTWGGGGAPLPGIDPSWHAGLNLALDRGIEHGDGIVFTYGPLGFLKSNLLFYAWPARLAALYGIAVHFALSLSLVWAIRRSLPLPIAVALALVAAVLMRGDAGGLFFKPDATVPVLAFIWCVAALDERRSELARGLVVYAGGPVAAIEVLGKLNTGVVVLAMLAITVAAIGPDRWRSLLAFGGSFLASLVVLWLAAGQGADTAGDYLGSGLEIVSGYVTAMGASGPGREEDILLAPAVVAIAFAIGWFSTRDVPRGRRAVILVLLAGLVFSAFKAGFVRHTAFQMSIFYATILGACLAFRLPALPSARFFGGIAVAGVAAAGFSTSVSGYIEYPMTDPVENLDNGFSTVRTLVEPDRAAEEIAQSRARLNAAYRLDRRTLELVDDEPVHVDPWEAGVAWAHDLEWRPLPVFQTYAAYTEELDRRNAEALASEDGPQRILRQPVAPTSLRYPGSISDRYPGFDSPAAMTEMLCNFRALRTTPRWQVLGRVPDRCGEPVELEAVDAAYGDPVRVPTVRGDRVVFARVRGIEVSGLERLTALAYRAESREISFDGDPAHTLVPNTAADGLLLRAPRRVDFPRPFEIAPNPREITFTRGGEASGGDLTIEFFAMRVSPRRE